MFEYFVIPALRRMSTTIFNTLPHASLIKFACVRHLTSNENVILFHNNISFRGIIFFLVFLNSRPLLVISHTFLHASPTQLIIFFCFCSLLIFRSILFLSLHSSVGTIVRISQCSRVSLGRLVCASCHWCSGWCATGLISWR